MNDFLDMMSRDLRVFMLPDADGEPAHGREALVGVEVPQAVPLNLGAPVVGICAWRLGVYLTSMPEATVQEYRDALPREDEVC
jgi:hypothetical protein